MADNVVVAQGYKCRYCGLIYVNEHSCKEKDMEERKQKAYENVERAAEIMIKGMYLDLGTPELEETPRRIAKMYVNELCRGLFDPKPKMTTFPNPKCDEMVMVKDIDVHSLCEHHFVPFIGKAYVAYIPNEKIVGLSKIVRLVDWCARRPQVQERLTQQIAEELQTLLKPKGVAVFMQCHHLCMMIRGVNQQGLCSTTKVLGNFIENSATRKEFFDTINIEGGYRWK